MSSWGRFLLAVGLLCGGAYAAAYAFGISPGYCAHSRSYADAAPCYKYDVRGVKVDVLLAGDSSLLYAIRPSLVEQASGLTSYNYGLVGPAFSFNPQANIDHYLATNARPKFIVVYLSPWNSIEPYVITDPVWFPIALLTLRHGSWIDFLRLFRARPSAIVEIPPVIFRSTQLSSAAATKVRVQMESDGGHLDFSATLDRENQTLAGHCLNRDKPPAEPYAADNRQALTALRAHYAARGLPLYVYVAPTAVCDGQIDKVQTVYAGVADNLPVAVPDRYFARGQGGHSHVNAEGVVVASNLFANFLSDHKLSPKDRNLSQ